MLTQLIQQTENVAEGLIEYEYREAEYEYEESPNTKWEGLHHLLLEVKEWSQH